MLNCIRQSNGSAMEGASHLSDGFNAAEQLRAEQPDLWRLLIDTHWTYSDNNCQDDFVGDFHMVASHAVLEYANTLRDEYHIT